MRLRIPEHEAGDVSAKIERTLSFYEDRDKQFENLGQLQAQTKSFVAIHGALERPYFPRKRKRSLSTTPSEKE